MRRYTWKPDLPDQRDHKFGVSAGVALPTKVDLRSTCSPVEDQGDLSSCTGQAIVGALEYLEFKAKQPLVNLSRLFVYYQERVIENSVKVDSGATIRSGIKACNTVGVCHEAIWPYTISKFKIKPTKQAYADAANRKITEYMRINDLPSFRGALAIGFPVVFGFSVYESFESDAVAKTGKVPMPKKTEKLLGGHAVLAVGYDDTKNWAICRNSWGLNWGIRGYFYMPYAYLTDRNLSDDFWAIRK